MLPWDGVGRSCYIVVVERIIEDALLGMNMTPIRLTRKQIGLYGLCMWVSEGDCPGGWTDVNTLIN